MFIITNWIFYNANLNEKDEIDAFWRDEVERSVEEIRNGKAKLISGEQVF